MIYFFSLIEFSFFFLMAINIAHAEDPAPNKIDRTHEKISTSIFIITNKIDSFFGSKISYEENNGSNLRLYLTGTQQEYDEFKSEPNFQLNVRFRELEKRLNFRFERSNTTTDTTNQKVQGPIETTVVDDKTNSAYSTSLGFILEKTSTWNISVDSGIKLESKLNPFARVRARKSIDFTHWELRMIEELINYTYGGLFQFTTVDFNIPINDIFDFRFVNNFSWEQRTDDILTTHGPSLYHILNEKMAMSYNIRSHFVNNPNEELFGHDLFISYRQLLYDTWFFYEIIPGISFLRERHFTKRGYMSAKIEAIFGNF